MTLTGVEIPRFAGLDLRDDAQEISGAAVDLMNADLSRLGRVRGRDGYAKFTSSAAAQRYINVVGFDPTDFNAPATFGNKCLYAVRVSGSSVFVDQITTGGVATQIFTASPATVDTSYALYSTGSGVIFGGAHQQLQTFSGPTPTVTPVATTFRAQYITMQTPDARIVLAAGTTVAFSDPLLLTFSATNNVPIGYDPEYISGMVSWGNSVFVFKRSSFYVFYGNSTDGTGQPIFNFRAVRNGVGCAAERGVTVGSDGVYFIHSTGVYRATGPGPAQVISDPVRNIFTGDLPPYFQGLALNQAQIAKANVQWINDKLLVSYPSGSATANDRTLVFENGQWSLWDLPIGASTILKVTNQPDLMFAYASGTNDIGQFSTTPGTYTTDAGTTINWRYRLPFWNPGKAGTEADLFEWLLDGSGNVQLKTAVNDTTALGTGATVVLGTAPAIAQGRDSRGVMGRNISLELSGTGQSSVSRVIGNVASQTESGFKTP